MRLSEYISMTFLETIEGRLRFLNNFSEQELIYGMDESVYSGMYHTMGLRNRIAESMEGMKIVWAGSEKDFHSGIFIPWNEIQLPNVVTVFDLPFSTDKYDEHFFEVEGYFLKINLDKWKGAAPITRNFWSIL